MRPAFLTLALVASLAPVVAGCASAPQTFGDAAPLSPVSSPALQIGAKLDVGVSTVAAICDYPGGKAVLDKDLPGLTTRPEYMFFKDMTLRAMAPMSGGKLTEADLVRVNADLAALPSPGGGGGPALVH